MDIITTHFLMRISQILLILCTMCKVAISNHTTAKDIVTTDQFF